VALLFANLIDNAIIEAARKREGHNDTNFDDPKVQSLLLRRIAWAGKWPVDALMEVKVPPNCGGRGRGAVA
jgi:hypothetical protein